MLSVPIDIEAGAKFLTDAGYPLSVAYLRSQLAKDDAPRPARRWGNRKLYLRDDLLAWAAAKAACKALPANDHNPGEVVGQPLSPAMWIGRQWAVTSYGIEARNGNYAIERGRLKEGLSAKPSTSWIGQVGTKLWCDASDFFTAYMVASAIHRVPLSDSDFLVLIADYLEAQAIKVERKMRGAC